MHCPRLHSVSLEKCAWFTGGDFKCLVLSAGARLQLVNVNYCKAVDNDALDLLADRCTRLVLEPVGLLVFAGTAILCMSTLAVE